jgi:hypothetical protein
MRRATAGGVSARERVVRAEQRHDGPCARTPAADRLQAHVQRRAPPTPAAAPSRMLLAQPRARGVSDERRRCAACAGRGHHDRLREAEAAASRASRRGLLAALAADVHRDDARRRAPREPFDDTGAREHPVAARCGPA